MTQQKSRLRKIVYGILILVLLLPLFFLGRPSAIQVTSEGVDVRQGGILSQILAKEELADVQLGDIDPAGSAIKLATFGMRGVAIAILWHQSQEFEKRRDWDNAIATGKQVIRLEPHFTSIWEFIGWKLAYNASSQFDDYRERYRWVIRGFDFIVDGTRCNRKSPVLFHKAGWTISQKIGVADEKEQYRRLFREDDEFHQRYHTPSIADRDNWLFGRNWYLQSEALVQKGANLGKQSQELFFSHSRLNLIHYAEWQELDGNFGADGSGAEVKALWANAEQAWKEFGRMVFTTTIKKPDGTYWETSFLKYDECAARIDELVKELDNLAPELYNRLTLENWDRLLERSNGEELQASLLEWLLKEKDDKQATLIRQHLDQTRPNWQEKFKKLQTQTIHKAFKGSESLLEVPALFMDEQQQMAFVKTTEMVNQLKKEALGQIYVSPQHLSDMTEDKNIRPTVLKLREEIADNVHAMGISRVIRDLLNYPHREKELALEQQEETIQARRYLFEARKAYRNGDQKEANTLWIKAMQYWEDVAKKPGFDDILDDELFSRDILDLLNRYVIILDAEEKIFPESFPLQDALRRHLWTRFRFENQELPLAYIAKLYDEGDYVKTLACATVLMSRLCSLNSDPECMKLAPLPEVRDWTLRTMAYIANCCRKLQQPLPPNFDGRVYIDLMLKHDPLQQEAVGAANEAVALTESENYPEVQSAFEKAIEKWKAVLDRYPMIYLQRESMYFGILREIAQDYRMVLERQGKVLPEDFALATFLQ